MRKKLRKDDKLLGSPSSLAPKKKTKKNDDEPFGSLSFATFEKKKTRR